MCGSSCLGAIYIGLVIHLYFRHKDTLEAPLAVSGKLQKLRKTMTKSIGLNIDPSPAGTPRNTWVDRAHLMDSNTRGGKDPLDLIKVLPTAPTWRHLDAYWTST
jgi:hypothetical protein